MHTYNPPGQNCTTRGHHICYWRLHGACTLEQHVQADLRGGSCRTTYSALWGHTAKAVLLTKVNAPETWLQCISNGVTSLLPCASDMARRSPKIPFPITSVSCQKDPICHAWAWRVGPFWQDALYYRHIGWVSPPHRRIAVQSLISLWYNN